MRRFAFLLAFGIAIVPACTKFENAHGFHDAGPETHDSSNTGDTSEMLAGETADGDFSDDGRGSDEADGSAGSGGALGTGGSGNGGASGAGGEAGADSGSGGATSDGRMETGSEAASETAPDLPADRGSETVPNICANYTVGSGTLAGVSAADFCQEYATVCTFTGANRYTDMGNCMSSYGSAPPAAQACRAGHLCNAKMATPGLHCVHATGAAVCP